MKHFLLLSALFVFTTGYSQNVQHTKEGEPLMRDFVFMKSNLTVTKYRNGDPIEFAETADEWKKFNKEGIGAYCYPKGDKSNKKLGLLYNYAAINDPRGLAPEGWHIPKRMEIVPMFNNGARFNDLLTEGDLGGRDDKGEFTKKAYWWYIDPTKPLVQNHVSPGYLGSASTDYGRKRHDKSYGCFVRCINDVLFYERNGVSQEKVDARIKEENEKYAARKKAIEDSLNAKGNQLEILFNEQAWGKNPSSVDISGKTYETVDIADITWTTSDLDVTKFQNGDEIPQARTAEEWNDAYENKKPAWCYYEFDKGNGLTTTKLYNFWAVNDARNIAPDGWHVPTKDEFQLMLDLMEMVDWSSSVLRSKDGWKKKGSNKSGFSATPTGMCFSSGEFSSREYFNTGYYWTSTGEGKRAFNGEISIKSSRMNDGIAGSGCAIRLVKD